jgi:hypothetical protein
MYAYCLYDSNNMRIAFQKFRAIAKLSASDFDSRRKIC